MKLLDVDDIERITIDAFYKDHSEECLLDVVVRFPKKYGIDSVSFNDAGLINAFKIKDCTEVLNPKQKILLEKVDIELYGCLQKHYMRKE